MTKKVFLSKHRIEVAKERLKSAKFLIDVGDYKAAANRSYYATFSAMRAVLALDGGFQEAFGSNCRVQKELYQERCF